MRFKISILVLLFLLTGCTTQYANKDITGQTFPAVVGTTLAQKPVSIPGDFNDELTLLLIGYVQNSQFDIDRWLIALDVTNTKVKVYEVPTIQGLFPEMFSTVIDNGMRAGIPKPLWQGVVTIYEDGEKIQAFTGNENAANTRVVLLNNKGEILYFYDQGFAVDALNELRLALVTQQ
ncbi:MAG: hypothetical protein V7736_08435 [Colwellia polaris]|jgi:hypothetical protein|uniref:hypothetical protein n=1 Tax=Colwellia polaris TaxID=326537 RepID=UPI000A16F9A0|nr:hypothetical protein [Colwellia polaris]|tara:strand:+ start:2702 stop:3232 length:531 start_codon:yes stop_codon:yes gene_type:complete